MKIINDVQAFDSFQHSAFKYLKSVSFSRNVVPNGSSDYDAEIVLSRGTEDDAQDLRVCCFGAVDIRVGDINGTHAILIGIQDISARQLEGINFRVVENENESFSLSCGSFHVELI